MVKNIKKISNSSKPLKLYFMSPKRGIFLGICALVFTVYMAVNIDTSRVSAATGINRTINFQGKVVNSNGTNVADGQYTFVFKLHDAASGGANPWTETQNNVQVTAGIFRVSLGSVTTFASAGVDFNTDNLYLGINFNSDGEMTPRVRFAAVPYAINAEKVAGLTVSNTTGTLTIPNSKTISFGGAFTTSAQDLTLTLSGATSITLPTSGTLATLAGTENLSNKTFTTSITSSGVTTDLTTGTNETLTITPNGTGNVLINPSAGGQAALIVDKTGLGDIFTASASGTTKFVIKSDGTASTSAGLTVDGVGSVQSTLNQTLTVGGGSTGDLVIGRTSQKVTLPGFDCSGFGNSGKLTTTSGGVLTCAADSAVAGGSTPFEANNGVITQLITTQDLLIGGTSTSSAKFAVLGINGSGPATATIAGNMIIMPQNGAGGRLGIGLTNPSYNIDTVVRGGQRGLNVTGTTSTASDSFYGAYNTLSYTGGAGSPGIIAGTRNDVSIAGANSVNSRVYGTYNSLTLGAASNNAYGSYNTFSSGAFTSTNMYGYYNDFGTNVSTNQNAYGLYNLASPPSQSGSTKTGVYNKFDNITSSNGFHNVFTADQTSVTLRGLINDFTNTTAVNGLSFTGVRNNFVSTRGATYIGVENSIPITGAAVTTYGVKNTLSANNSGTGNNLYGIHNDITNNGGSSAFLTYGAYTKLTTTGSSTPTSYGNYVLDSASSTLGTQIGYYSNLKFATTNWGLYIEDSSSPSYFGNNAIKWGASGVGDVTLTRGIASQLSLTGTALFTGGNTGGGAELILNQTGNSGNDILAASASGTTKFTIKNDGTASSSAGFTVDGVGSIQSTLNQTLTVGGGSTGDLIIGKTSQKVTLPGFDCSGFGNSGKLTTTSGGILTCAADISGAGGGDNFWQYNATTGIVANGNLTTDFLLGGTSTQSAIFSVLGIAAGTNPSASVSATQGGNATKGIYMSGDGSLQSVRNNTLTIGGTTTGDISFKPGNVSTPALYLTSGGNIGIGTTNPGATLDVVGSLLLGANSTIDTRASGTLTIGNGANTTGLTLGKAATTLTFNSASWTATPTISGLVTGTLGFSVATGQSFTGAGTVTLSSASNNDLTLAAQGTGNLIVTSDSDTGVRIGNNAVPAALFVGGGIGSNAGFILNRVGTADDIFAASSSGTTKFVIKNDGTASSSAGFTIDGIGNIQSTKNQTLTFGGGSSGDLIIGRTSQTVTLPGFDCSGLGNSGKLTTTSGGILTCAADISGGGSGSSNWTLSTLNGTLSPNLGTLDILLGGSTTVSAAFKVTGQDNPFKGTLAAASVSANTAFSGFVVDQNGVGDIFTASKSGATHFVITNAGNVGIGTNSPTTKLDVNGNASISGLLAFRNGTGIIQTTGNNTLQIGGSTTGNIIFPTAGGIFMGVNESVNGLITFFSSGVGETDPSIYADANGNLIITAPSGTVQVGNGSGNITMSLTIAADIFSADKTVSLSGNYSLNDFTFSRILTGGVHNQSGSIFKVTDTSGGSGTITTDLFLANAALTSGNFQGTLGRFQQDGVDKLRIFGNGTSPVATVSANSTFAAMIVDNIGLGDLFTASASGATKFTIKKGGGLQLDTVNYNNCTALETIAGLLTCGSDDASNWDIDTTNKTINMKNDTYDVLFGSAATGSAKFAFNAQDGVLTTFGLLRKQHGFREDFIRDRADAAISGLGLWSDSVAVDTCERATANFSNISDTNNGIFRTTTDAAGDGITVLTAGVTTCTDANYIYNAANKPQGLFQVRPSVIGANNDVYIGFSDVATDITAEPTNGVWMTNNDTGGTTPWIGVIKSGANRGTVTCTSQNINATQFALIKIEVLSTTQARFWVDPDISDGYSLVDCGVATLPAGTLTAQMSFMAHYKVNTSGTGAATFDVDFIDITQDDPENISASMVPISVPQDVNPVVSADLAEWYMSDKPEEMTPGTVLSIDKTQSLKVKKSDRAYDPTLIGVVTSSPHTVMGQEDHDERTVAVALSGRVPVKVNLEGGVIQPGDYLTSSSVEGVAMKVTRQGSVIGKALEDFDGIDEAKDRIFMFIEPGSYMGSADEYKENINEFLSGMSGLSIGLTSDFTNAFYKEEIIANELIAKKIITKSLVTDDITSGESGLTVNLKNGNFTLKNIDGSSIFDVDNQGNTRIHGTLFANKIVADQIEGLEIITSSISSLSEKMDGEGSEFTNKLKQMEVNQMDLTSQMASLSAKLEKIGAISLLQMLTQNQDATDVVLVNNFASYGTATMNEASILNNLTIGSGSTISIGSGSIDSNGSDLSIQSLRQGKVSFLGGYINFDTDGKALFKEDVTFEKNVSVKGVLSATTMIVTDLKLGQGATRTISDTETEATSAAGLITLVKDKDHVKVFNPIVRENSYIFITPKTKTSRTFYLLDQVEGKDGEKGYFKVGIDREASEDIKFNYLIVN